MNNLKFPVNELEALDKLNVLFADWKTEIGNEIFVEDGFYPYYFSQKIKILFVGRESRGMTGNNYIDVLFDAYKKNRVGNQSINTSFFHKRMLYIAYGLNKGMPLWQDIPYANEITPEFGVENGFSFAFMNLSKLSNENEAWVSDWDLIKQSCAKSIISGRNFFLEEIQILSPDVIITMNFEENHLDMFFDQSRVKLSEDSSLTTYGTRINNGNVLVMNTYHFAALSKDDVNDFYWPICNSINNHTNH